MDRRELLLAAAATAALPAAGLAAPANDGWASRFAAAAAAARLPIVQDRGRFSGGGYDWLLARGRESLFFLLGEEHGIAENPRLAAQLFEDLASTGYSRVAIEISPQMAEAVDQSLARGGIGGFSRLYADPASRIAFFGMREEAQWLAAARRAVPGAERMLWGTDYEVGADRHLIAMLKAKPKPAPAAAALAVLEQASSASWALFDATHKPEHIYSFAGDPALVRAVRQAWPKADPDTLWTLQTLEETFEINRLWVARRPWESNARRAQLMRTNFLRHWREEARTGRHPRVFLKFGASHMVRGRNSTETFDLGTLLPELAAIEGGKALQLLVLPGRGSRVAVLDPSRFLYAPQVNESEYAKGLDALFDQALPSGFTLFDTHPLRPLLGWSATPHDANLLRAVHGFDAILIMTGSTPSANL